MEKQDFRKHFLQEKRKRSKLRKQRKRGKQKETQDQCHEGRAEEKPVLRHHPAEPQKPAETCVRTDTKAANSDDKGKVEQLRAERDRLKRHAVKFHANWMESEKANLPAIAFENIIFAGEKPIGRGNYGVCRVGHYGGTPVAVKEIKKYSESKLEEAMILRKLRHPNIQMFIGVATQEDTVHIVTKFHGRKCSNKPITMAKAAEEKVLQPCSSAAFLQVCDAIEYLHSKMSVLHNDIKENNIIMEETSSGFIPILIDFGKACFFHEAKVLSPKPKSLQLPYIAPELYAGQRQSCKSDIFSFGYMMKCISHIGHDLILRELYRRCLCADPIRRPDIQSVREALERLREKVQ